MDRTPNLCDQQSYSDLFLPRRSTMRVETAAAFGHRVTRLLVVERDVGTL